MVTCSINNSKITIRMYESFDGGDWMNTTCKYLRSLTWILVVIAIGVLMIGEMNEIVRKGVILAMSISAAFLYCSKRLSIE